MNYYDNHLCKGTATDKGLAARLGGHSYNILSGHDKDEIYFKELRHQEHFVDKKGRHTRELFGPRRRKFPGDERGHMRECFKAPLEHPRQEAMITQRRTELQLIQMENPVSFNGFQNRSKEMLGTPPQKRYTINNKLYCNEVEKLCPRHTAKGDFMARRGEPMTHSISCPSLATADSSRSLDRAMRSDTRKEASQRQTESAHFAPWHAASTLANSMDSTPAGRELHAKQQYCSVNRLENYDGHVSRKNNHYSSVDKLTRSDPFFMRPRLAQTNNSVKYDIISNERRWFKYS